MALPKIIEGTGEELQDYLKQAPKERFRLILLSVEIEEPTILPDKPANPAAQEARDLDLVARVRSLRGKYAHLGVTTEDLHKERQADKDREERLFKAEKS